ncbi:MAG: ATP-binding cassette domain-containing protein [Haemophilus parainfluenzae]|nr:ATP-binding cassette domain-containing protein [Haemophilus parainfluenzae]
MTVSNNKELLLEVNHLGVSFKIKNDKSLFFAKPQTLKAVKDVSFKLYEGETLGVVGESGCGKSTLARAIIGLVEASEGEILWLGKNLRKQSAKIYQPHLSAAEVKEKVQAMMLKVGLLPNLINRYPHEFSGGQCQRIGIARALIIEPKMIICDEPVSALDVSIQAQVVNLLKSLQKEMGLSLIFIAHDLAVVKHISDRVLVMYLGNAMELGSDEEVYNNTKHPYTKALMSAVPIPDPKLERNKSIELLEGELPSPINPPSGCVFRTRCLKADENCAKQKPPFTSQNNSHFVACLKVL